MDSTDKIDVVVDTTATETISEPDSREASRSWFCVFNNPKKAYDGEPSEIAEKALAAWVTDHSTRTGAVAYCISADGMIHLHMVLEDTLKARFSAVKATYPKAHIEATKGNKEQAEDYINKRGKYEEKGEQVLYVARHGEIKGRQGKRNDLDTIEELIAQGLTPAEIMRESLSYRRYEKMIRDAYFDMRKRETPLHRDITVYWHVGASGSGKSYQEVLLAEQHGEDSIYRVADYGSGFMDKYCGEPILFLDELRDQIAYPKLLAMLSPYRSQISARYTNTYCLWSECHITSVYPPEDVYDMLVDSNKKVDSFEQLRRRITYIVYHHKQGDNYCEYKTPMSEYTKYQALVKKVESENQGVGYLLSAEPVQVEPLLECEPTPNVRSKYKKRRPTAPMLRSAPKLWDYKIAKIKNEIGQDVKGCKKE